MQLREEDSHSRGEKHVSHTSGTTSRRRRTATQGERNGPIYIEQPKPRRQRMQEARRAGASCCCCCCWWWWWWWCHCLSLFSCLFFFLFFLCFAAAAAAAAGGGGGGGGGELLLHCWGRRCGCCCRRRLPLLLFLPYPHLAALPPRGDEGPKGTEEWRPQRMARAPWDLCYRFHAGSFCASCRMLICFLMLPTM